MTGLFLKLLNMSIAAGWLVLAVVVLRLVLARAPKAIRCLLWGIVGLRLILPFSMESVLSLVPSVETVSPQVVQFSPAPTITSGVPVIDSAVNPVISEVFAPAPAASVNPLYVLTNLASWVWLIGLTGMLLYFLISTLRLRRRVADAVLVRDNIFESAAVPSPFVFGFFRPRVYLPVGLDRECADYVIPHELAHIRRRDHWIKPVGFLILSVYWFNPVLWLAYILLCRDIELACDERVLAELGTENKKAYSNALLSVGTFRRHVSACPVAFGEGGVKSRVKNVLNYKKPAFWLILVALIACAAVAVCFLTDPKGKADENIFGRTYTTGKQYYGNSIGFADSVTLSADRSLSFLRGNAAWYKGTFTEASYSRKEFDRLFLGVNNTKSLRQQNQKLWKTEPEGDTMYLLLLQRSGELILAECYYDAEGETDPYSDDSGVRWMVLLVPEGAAGTQVTTGKTSKIKPADIPGLTLTLDEHIYTWGEPIRFTITNDTGATYGYSSFGDVSIEMEVRDKWRTLDIQSSWGVDDPLYYLAPGRSVEKEISNLFRRYGDVAEPGFYRLVVPLIEDPNGEHTTIYLTAVFTVETWRPVSIGPAVSNRTPTEVPGLTLSLDKSAYFWGEPMGITATNGTDITYALSTSIGSVFHVLVDGQWHELVPKENWILTQAGLLLFPGATAEETLSGIYRMYGDVAAPGHYRVIAPVHDENTSFYLAAEFDIVEPGSVPAAPDAPEEPAATASPEELKDRAAQVLSTADTVSSYVTEYDLNGQRFYVRVPLVPPPIMAGQRNTIRDLMHSLDLSGFEPYNEEPAAVQGAFLVHNGDAFLKVETGYTMTPEEVRASGAMPEEVILTLTFTDTGESVRLIGPDDGTASQIWAMSDQRTSTDIVTWQHTYPDTWMEESGYIYPMADITVYDEGGAVIEQALAGNPRMTYPAAMLASVLENVPAVLTPIPAPAEFHMDREFEIAGRDYGIGAYDLKRDILRVGGAYYDLTQMDANGLIHLHGYLFDWEYEPKQ